MSSSIIVLGWPVRPIPASLIPAGTPVFLANCYTQSRVIQRSFCAAAIQSLACLLRVKTGCLRNVLGERLHLTSGFGGFASRRDRNSKLSNWSDRKRRACCVPGHLHQHHAHSASPRWRSCHGSRVGERRSRSCRIWRGVAHLASCRSATWIPRGPHHRPRRFRRLERPCLCNTSRPTSCFIALPAGPFE